MINCRIYCVLFFVWAINTIQSQIQNPDYARIANSLTEYFKLERENIHLHLNKNTYLTNEKIWFTGYVIEKSNKMPFLHTSNVYVALIDQSGKEISTSLYYCENGICEGSIRLSNTLKTGKYYLQVYTNFMNNFSENESSIYEISIINPSQNQYTDSTQINYSQIEVEFFPESGIFLEGTSNPIVIKITDCNKNGISVTNGLIVDSKGNTATEFSTNELGYGKFEIFSTNAEYYKAIFDVKGVKAEQSLPFPVNRGIALSAINYIAPDKAMIKVRTNAKTLVQSPNQK